MHQNSHLKLPVPQPVKKFHTSKNQKVHYHIHKIPSLGPIQNQIKSMPSYPSSLRSTLMSSSHQHLKSSKWSLSFKFHYQKAAYIFLPLTAFYIPHPFQLLHFMTWIICGENSNCPTRRNYKQLQGNQVFSLRMAPMECQNM